MLLTLQIPLKPLAQLCHRLATATNAGLQDRKIWLDEAQRGSSGQRRVAAAVHDQLAQGVALTDALRVTGEYFPPLFRQMAEVGEVSGRLGEIYKRLARHYDQVLAARRAFGGRLMWPLFQLGIALLTIGFLIWIMGALPINKGAGGTQFDILGWGLVGTPGLVKYVNILLLLAIAVWLAVTAARRGMQWVRPIQRAAVTLPILGGALQTLALSKFTWAMQLVLDTPMDLRKAVPLALHTTGNDYYAQHAADVVQNIEQGRSLTQSLALTGVFPNDLLDNIAVGEESGKLVETMERQAREYEERAGVAISVLAQFAGYAIWILVAVFIIFMIIRIFSAYVDTLNSLM